MIWKKGIAKNIDDSWYIFLETVQKNFVIT